MGRLVWPPLRHGLAKAGSGAGPFFVFSPFIRLDALRSLQLEGKHRESSISVVTRWRPEDFASGAAELAVFPYLRSIGASLFVHPELHMKLYCWPGGKAVVTSANVTLSGLGLIQPANVEVGTIVQLEQDDMAALYRLVAQAYLVDDAFYQHMRDVVAQIPATSHLPLPSIKYPTRSGKSIWTLPTTHTPEELLSFYLDQGVTSSMFSPESHFRHDLVVLEVPHGLPPLELREHLRCRLESKPLVAGLIDHLRMAGTLRFGSVVAYLARNVEDVPAPSREQLEETTRVLYNWLSDLVPGISWKRPRFSQVLFWTGPRQGS